MIELTGDRLAFPFPEVFPDARLTISLMRTLRIPDDGRAYPLPAGLGLFPIRHVDDFGDSVPRDWITRGGVLIPMYQSEEMWVAFSSMYVANRMTSYPFAVKIATGRINAVDGKGWRGGLRKTRQNYMVVPGQPWLDGYAVEEGLIRQFVAMPLGAGYTAEEQMTGKAEFGGMQICVYPMKRETFEELFPVRQERALQRGRIALQEAMPASEPMGMGLAPGGLMKQEIYKDRFGVDVWDTRNRSRCFIHMANSLVWRAITDEEPPLPPLTSRDYGKAGIPWFDYYNEDLEAVGGAEALAELRSVIQMGHEKGETPLPENESSDPVHVIDLSPKKNRVREW